MLKISPNSSQECWKISTRRNEIFPMALSFKDSQHIQQCRRKKLNNFKITLNVSQKMYIQDESGSMKSWTQENS